MTARIGAVGYAVAQGLGHLMRDFVRAGVVTHPVIWPHRQRQNHPEWYGTASMVAPEAGSLAKFIRQNGKRYFDVLLAFETFFDWSAIDACRAAGIKTALCVMQEWTPRTPPAFPDLVLCPSKLDYDYFCGRMLGHGAEAWVSRYADKKMDVAFLPIPVDPTTWRPRTRALRWLHNAGNVGHRWHKGTLELLKAVPLVKNPDFRITVRAQDQREMSKVIAEAGAAAKDARITYQRGEVPYAELWDGFDVCIAPERFNGLSLPLQEARAAGLLVVTSDRFPHNDWLPKEMVCPACDGDGSKMYQWAKEACVKFGGKRAFMPDGSWYYTDGQGREIGFKTIGGLCNACQGHKVLSPLVPVSGYHRASVGSSYLEFDEAEVRPEDIAAKIDELHGADISEYSESGRAWAEANSWNALRGKWLEALTV